MSGIFLLLLLPALQSCAPEGPKVSSVQEIPKIRPVTPEERKSYLGSEACASCHSEQFAAHDGSHHAETLSLVTAETHGERFQKPSDVTDPKRELHYVTGVKDGQCIQTVTTREGTDTIAAKYGFGSGKHGVTYMGEFQNRLLELRLSFYPEVGRWHFSPGQKVEEVSGGMLFPSGLVKTADVMEECFNCHTTALVKEGQRIQPEKAFLGLGCESCHGPGKAHVEAINTGSRDIKMARLGQMRERLSTELCGQCHRSPAGDDLNEPFNKAQLPRLQGLALPQSPCFTNSEGRLSCLTCHNAHGDTKLTLAEYDGKCISCHSSAPAAPQDAHAVCPIEPTRDCVSCHMPKQDVNMPFGLKFRTHWIKVW
ncbi:MAG: multiheme c-type cytochrome [Armatimonadota bacterium]